jgi:hypothetical protein
LLENQSTAVEAPRDRNGTFEPVIAPKREKRLPLFNDQIISMYLFGMADRDIKPHLEKIYNVEVPPDLISRVTNAALEDMSPPIAGRMTEPSFRKIIRYSVFGRIEGRQNGRKKQYKKRIYDFGCQF